jgi:glyoxalase family protein
MQLRGLHHITAITGDAPANVAFYTEALGMRLVKKTVNQDDVSAYHLFYGDALGQPGTELTFFDWPNIGGTQLGAGSIAAIALRVAGRETVAWWAQRLPGLGVRDERIVERNGQVALAFRDPEGQRLLLVDDGGAPGGRPWPESPVPPEMAIRGLHSTTIIVDRLDLTRQVFCDVLGMRETGSYPFFEDSAREVVVFALGDGGPGAEIHVEVRPDLPPGRPGIGGVHHMAFRTPDADEQRRWRAALQAAHLGVTPVIDRFYFRSIYFREPGGVLCEIATDGPGFTADEDAAHLGERLSLPPFLEPHRAAIEAGLRPLG